MYAAALLLLCDMWQVHEYMTRQREEQYGQLYLQDPERADEFLDSSAEPVCTDLLTKFQARDD